MNQSKKEPKQLEDIIQKTCPICGKRYVKVVNSAWRIGKQEFCSYNCYRKVECKQLEKQNTQVQSRTLKYSEMLLRELDIELVKDRSKKHGTVMCGNEEYCFYCDMEKFKNTYCCGKSYKKMKEQERRCEREKKTETTKAIIKKKSGEIAKS